MKLKCPWLKWLIFPALLFLFASCSSISYFCDAIKGHFEILNKAEPIDEVISREATPPHLKKTLINIRQAREFAVLELLLPANGSYFRYADIGRKCVTWNVIATEEFSVVPEEWCFPVAGCVSYKGFFNPRDAKNFASDLQERGLDTCIVGAAAYSTLGWFEDPILSTMIYRRESDYVNVLFHELAHQKLYVKNDTAFNEAFATSVAEEGIRRWFARTGDVEAYEEYLISRQRSRKFNALILRARDKLKSLYNQKTSPEVMRRQKVEIFQQLQTDYSELKKQWDGDARYDAWMAKRLNNAHLALVATYNDIVPIFRLMIQQSDGNLKSFYDRAAFISSQPYEKRHQVLKQIYAQREKWKPVPTAFSP
ncbi:MAG: aminopeptidase [Deltaproteobacteria bacterium]|nr:aminopeptidase [Deltaproteobacteria bacterium]